MHHFLSSADIIPTAALLSTKRAIDIFSSHRLSSIHAANGTLSRSPVPNLDHKLPAMVPAMAPTTCLAVDGDLRLHVGGELEVHTTLEAVVSSKTLSGSSPVFEAMLRSGYKKPWDSWEKRCGCNLQDWCITLPVDGPPSMQIFLIMIHYPLATLRRQIRLSELHGVLMLCDKYLVGLEIIKPWARTLFRPYAQPRIRPGMEKLLWSAWQLGSWGVFRCAMATIPFHNGIDAEGQLVDSDGKLVAGNTFFGPSEILGEYRTSPHSYNRSQAWKEILALRRAQQVGQFIQVFREMLTQLRNSTPGRFACSQDPSTRLDCDSARYRTIVESLPECERRFILGSTPAADYQRSWVHLINCVVRKVRLQNHHNVRACNPFIAVGEELQDWGKEHFKQFSRCLLKYKAHLAGQRTKTGL